MRSGASSSTTFFAEGRRLGRYFLVGGVAACVDIGVFMLFAGHLGMPYLRVACASFILATLVNYVLSVRLVFVSGERYPRRWEIVLVYAISALGLAINQAVLYAGVDLARLSLLASKLAATGTVFFWNYGARRVFVFGAMRD